MPLNDSQKKLLKESLIIWFVVILLARLAGFLDFIPLIAENVTLITAVLLLYAPIGVYLKKKEKIDFLDQSLGAFSKSLVIAIVFSMGILGLASIFVWMAPGFSFVWKSWSDLGEFFLGQLLLIALPEEFFFRGYLQGRFNRIFDRKWKILGTRVGVGLILASVLFAISHSVMTLQVWHPLIFFPALAFGWLRDKTGSITASIFFHALCNVFSYLVITPNW